MGQFGEIPGFGGKLVTQKAQVEVKLVKQYDVIGSGQGFGIAVILDIKEGWHLYRNPLKGDSSIGLKTEVVPYGSKGVEFGGVQYPDGTAYRDKLLDTSYFIYEGEIICLLPVRVTGPGSGNYAVDLELTGLICAEETGTCLPWSSKVTVNIELSDDVEVVSAGIENRGELFLGIDWAAVKWEEARVKRSGVERGGLGGNGVSAGRVLMPDYQPQDFDGTGIGSADWLPVIFLALAAGVILNLMPCVLPVIPLKVLSLIKQGQADDVSGDRYKSFKLALVFSGGIVLVFVVLALVMSGFQMLYGQQFQSLTFKFVMLMVIFVLALSMLGLFEVTMPSYISNIQIVRKGYVGALGMGVLATLLATPCSAPLLGPVLTWSLSKPPAITVAVFVVIGVGMASPYVLLTAFPGLMNRIPKAGPWMLRMKQGLGFVMLAVAVYLVFLFPARWHLPLLIFCLIVAMAIWLGWHVVGISTARVRRAWARGIAAALVICGGMWLLNQARPLQASPFEAYTPERLMEYHKQGRVVMVEFTADWCPNCKYVELTVLKRQEFKDKLAEMGAVLLIADWTHDDPAITELLNQLGSKSIPFTAVFGGDDYLRPYVLRDIYSLETILKVLGSLEQESSG
ncbi:MAG: thioredoxin family protein [Planctomycetes bacterium]|nr:thioredoxin family protein [Planctomycetota bacterium]